MMIDEILSNINNEHFDKTLSKLYLDDSLFEYQRERYTRAVNRFRDLFGDRDVQIYSTPGRSEVCGNHTDHQQGKVLATSINLDAIAVVSKSDENRIKLLSGEYPLIDICLDELAVIKSEQGTTRALIKGVAQGLKNEGYKLGGFNAYVTSDVLMGAGLSSSAAFEGLVGVIISGLFNDMSISPEVIAKVGQYAENIYFGKPCGLMDQMACCVGGLIHIDFSDSKHAKLAKVTCDLNKAELSLCIVDTKGSHSDLTHEYAAVPAEMKKVAGYFGKEVLLGISEEEILSHISELREKAGDRAVLRALHLVEENKRVDKAFSALKDEDFDTFLDVIKASGNSSFKYLQNVYSMSDLSHQNVSLALCISEMVIKDKGVCRVHGGGFAGTIQAFVKNESAMDYKKRMDDVFGKGACSILKIRDTGCTRVM